MEPIHVRDDFSTRNGRYVSRSFASYPSGEAVRLSFQNALHLLAETETSHADENKGRLRPPFLDEYFSLKPKEAEASGDYEWFGHILVPAKAALTDRLNDEKLVLAGVKKSSSMQLINSIRVYKDGKTTVLEADPKEIYELDFSLPENITCGNYIINESLIDPKTGFLKGGIRLDDRKDESVDGLLSIAQMDFCPLQPYLICGRGRRELYLEPLSLGLTTHRLRFASNVDPTFFMKTGEESLRLVQSKAGEILRDKIKALQNRLWTVKKIDSGATLSGRALEMELEELQKISRRYFPEEDRKSVQIVSA